MNRKLCLFLSLLAGLVLHGQEIVSPEESEEKPQVFEGRTGSFEFVAADQGSLQVARRIGREVFEVCDELITLPAERIPRISVKLAPAGRGNLEGESYRLYQDIADDYGVAISWTPDLSISQFTQALVEAYFRQIVYTLSDRQRSEEFPPWLIAGATLRVQVALRPSLIEYLKYLGRESEMISLEELVEKTSLEQLTPADRIASYWFLEMIERYLGNEKKVRKYFDTVIEGTPAIEVFQRQAAETLSLANGIEAWWVIGFQDLVHRENGIVLSVERTGKKFAILNRFELLDFGQVVSTTTEGLWGYRDNEIIRQALARRLMEIETFMPRANPVFYNAFRSLGLLMQQLLDGEQEAFDLQVIEFRKEIAIALSLAEDVLVLGQDPNAQIP